MDEHNFVRYTGYWAKNRIVARACLAHNPKKVLEVGCGEGKLIRLLRDEGVEAWGVDIENNMKYDVHFIAGVDAKDLPFKDKLFDVVVSNDFFEHIAEQDIDKVYNEMSRVGKHVIARISLKEKDNHLTVKPISWWKEKLPGCEFIGKDWNK